MVRRLVGAIVLCLLTLPALCQSTAKYQVATILEVKPHQGDGAHPSGPASYDISVKVGNTIYVVLYTHRSGENDDPKYIPGRDVLVQVGKKTITYNDIMGQSHEVPILSQQPVPAPKGARAG